MFVKEIVSVSRVIASAFHSVFHTNNYNFRGYPNITSLSLEKTKSVWYDDEESEID